MYFILNGFRENFVEGNVQRMEQCPNRHTPNYLEAQTPVPQSRQKRLIVLDSMAEDDWYAELGLSLQPMVTTGSRMAHNYRLE